MEIQQHRQSGVNALIDSLHDSNLSSGEILSGSDLADAIFEFEQYNNEEFTADEIRKAARDAGERFVDSMIDNAIDTPDNEHWNSEEVIKHYESMRPSAIRKKQLAEIVASD